MHDGLNVCMTYVCIVWLGSSFFSSDRCALYPAMLCSAPCDGRRWQVGDEAEAAGVGEPGDQTEAEDAGEQMKAGKGPETGGPARVTPPNNPGWTPRHIRADGQKRSKLRREPTHEASYLRDEQGSCVVIEQGERLLIECEPPVSPFVLVSKMTGGQPGWINAAHLLCRRKCSGQLLEDGWMYRILRDSEWYDLHFDVAWTDCYIKIEKHIEESSEDVLARHGVAW